MDQYPYRENTVDATIESILCLTKFDEILQKKRSKIDEILKLDDAIEMSKFLRSLLI